MKRILIIGATSAIATACARHWAMQGSQFCLVGRSPEKLHALADDLRARGAHDVHTLSLDLSDVAAHASMLAQAFDLLVQIDVALIAHGTLPDQHACENSVALAMAEIHTNGVSVVALLSALATFFEQQRKGAIAVISSVAGDRGRPSNYVYGSAKAMISTFSEGLRARMFKSGVSVTDIRPGFIATPMTAELDLPQALVVTPEAVAPRLIKAIESGKDVVYAPAFWALIMLIIRSVPRVIFKRLSL